MAQTTPQVSDTLKINVRHGDNGEIITTETTASTPNTGVGHIASELGATGCSAIGIAFVAIILFCLRGKLFKKTKFKAIPSLALLLISGALATTGAITGADAAKLATEINITTNPKTSVIGNNSRNVELNENYEHGYTIYAYLNNVDDNNIYNADLSAKIVGTEPTDSLENLSLNSYGIKNQVENGYYALPIGENNAMPIYTTGDSAKKGDIFTSDYAVKLDNTIPEGTYSSDAKDGEIIYEIKPGQLINVSADASGEISNTVLAICDNDICIDAENNHYVDPDKDGIYVYAYTVNFNSNNNNYGTVSPTTIENVPHGTTLSTSNNTITVNDKTVTATAKSEDYEFKNWTNGDKTITENNLTVTANFDKVAAEYEITLNNNGATTAGTEKIYEIYNEKYALTSRGAKMTSTENPIIVPTKTNSYFLGYYTDENGNGTQYINADGYLTTDADAAHFEANGTLYAHWTDCNPGAKTVAEAEYLQCLNTDVKDSMTLETSYTLKDMRDEKSYTVAKLKDGNIWMTQNLDLTLDKNITLTNKDTDLNSVDSWTPETSTTAGSTGYSDDSFSARSAKPASKTYTYYNFPAAVASNDIRTTAVDNQSMPDSICPKGWKLPTSFSGLLDAYNIAYGATEGAAYGLDDSALVGAPLNFDRTGYLASGELYPDFNRYGVYWTSIVNIYQEGGPMYKAKSMVFSDYNPAWVVVHSIDDTLGATAIRCIAR